MPEQSDPPHRAVIPLPGMNCGHCGKFVEAGAATDGRDDPPPPVPGSLMACLGCGELNVYEVGPGGSSLRAATPEEEAELSGEDRLLLAHFRATRAAGTDPR